MLTRGETPCPLLRPLQGGNESPMSTTRGRVAQALTRVCVSHKLTSLAAESARRACRAAAQASAASAAFAAFAAFASC